MKTVLVIPCFNEANRLDKTQFKSAEELSFLFVNDGSTDETFKILQNFEKEGHAILNLEKNLGKAGAVRAGMLEASIKFPDATWIGFWDADLATPLSQVEYMLGYLKLESKEYDAIFGSRVLRLGSHIERLALRHMMGRIFVTYSSLVLGSHAYDSQCGAKIFKATKIDEIFEKPFISKWFFDMEIIQRMLLRNLPILECPLQAWRDVAGSKVRPLVDGLKAFIEVIKIRKAYGKIKNIK